MSAALIIPARNEGDRLRTLLHDLRDVCVDLPRLQQIILILDGCSDHSIRHARCALSTWPKEAPQLLVLERDRSEGKAAAVQSALVIADARYVITWDADLEYGLAGLPAILAALSPRTLISGVRQSGLGWRSRWANRLVRLLLCRHGATPTDVLTGVHAAPYELIDTALKESHGYAMETAIVALALARGWYRLDLPVPYRARGFRDGRGIRARDLVPIAQTALSSSVAHARGVGALGALR